ncbi:MAG: hypothetical protein LIO54_03735, partial [Oscillospiraceae bacterium]|nr:hypothetical protein [Oscillospiraceae bacterium]
AGLMSASDKTKLDGVATGATANTGTITGITTTSPLSGSGTSGSVALSHASSGATAGSYGDSAAQTPAFGGTFKVPYATVNATGHVTGISAHTVTIPSTAATTSAAGLMSASDKTKLDGVATGANAYTHPTVTASDTTSTASPAHSGTFTAVDSVARDAYGHVTGVNTKTITLPSDNNTDTKVTQTLTSSHASYPLLLAPSGQTATTTTTANFGTAFQANPSTGTLTASTFSGALSGNATTATTATKLGSSTVGGAAKPIYLSSGAATACSSTVGSADIPVYMSSGTITSSGVSLSGTYKKWRYALVGQSNSTTTNPYYKFAEISTTASYTDPWISFKVTTGYGDKTTACGILTAHFRAGSSGYWETGELVWEYADSGISTSKFILAHNESANPTVVELWAVVDTAYRLYHFSVLAEGNRSTETNANVWTLYQTSSAGSESEITSGYTQVESTFGTLKNDTSGNAATASNASTATKLNTARTIDGVSFDGSAAIIHYGTCSTAADTAAKVVSCTGFSLVTGARIVVKFSYVNKADAPTLNVNDTGDIAIVGYGTTVTNVKSWSANSLVEFIYDGTSWVILSAGCEGQSCTATGSFSHAEGSNTTATGDAGSHAEGRITTASASAAHAEGYNTTASGQYSHAQGYSTEATGNYSHAEGYYTTASISASHAEGYYTTASISASHAEGYRTKATNLGSHAGGKYNSEMSNGDSAATQTGDVFVIGNGTGSGALGNAFRVTYAGAVYGLSAFNSSGADYAEFILPWSDGNPDAEDRVGYFVTIDGDSIRKAQSGEYIAGITSGNPSVVGNGDETYYWKYERDEFDRIVWEDVAVTEQQTDEDGNPVTDENGDPVMVETGEVIENGRMKLSDDYDAAQTYTPRKDRPEWDYVGMVGVLPVRDDGTCVAGGWCCCGTDGIGTAAESRGWDTYFVIERISDSVVRVVLK